jgi:hypothetical protein
MVGEPAWVPPSIPKRGEHTGAVFREIAMRAAGNT